MLCLRSAKVGSPDLMLSHTRFLLASETTFALSASCSPARLRSVTWAPSISRVCKTGAYFCLSCAKSAMRVLLKGRCLRFDGGQYILSHGGMLGGPEAVKLQRICRPA